MTAAASALSPTRRAGWTIAITGPGGGSGKAGWDPGKKEFFCTLREGGEFRVPVSEDPFLGLTYHGSFQTLFLILPDNLAGAIGEDTGPGSARADGLRLSVLSAGVYHSRVLAPLLDEVNPRLQRIFRYSRPLSGYGSPGSGDIIYTLEPGSGMSTAVLLEVDGFGPVFREISPGLPHGHIFPAGCIGRPGYLPGTDDHYRSPSWIPARNGTPVAPPLIPSGTSMISGSMPQPLSYAHPSPVTLPLRQKPGRSSPITGRLPCP